MGVLGGIYILVEEVFAFGLMVIDGLLFLLFYDTNGVNDNDGPNFTINDN